MPRFSASRLLAAGSLLIGVSAWAAQHHEGDIGLAALVADGTPAPFGELQPMAAVFVFRPTDCALSSAQADSINALPAHLGIRFRAVMVEPPPDSLDARRLAAELGLGAKVHLDYEGVWRSALARDHIEAPLIILSKGSDIVGIISPHRAQAIARIAKMAAY